MGEMAIPGLSGVDAQQIKALITHLRDLLSQQQGPGASGPRGSQGCQGNESQEFQNILDQIRALSDQLESLESGRFGNDDNRNGNGLNIRISV
jgi:hypothetical protein